MTIRDFPAGKRVPPIWDGVANIHRADAEYERLTRGAVYYICGDCHRRCRGAGHKRLGQGGRRYLTERYCHECSRAHDPEGRYPTPSYAVYE